MSADVLRAEMARPILAYIAAVAVGVIVLVAADGMGASANALSLWALAAFLLIPAMTLHMELLHRSRAASRVMRSLLGAATWGGYGLALAAALSVVSRVVLLPEKVGVDLAIFAASGALFALLAFDGTAVQPGRTQRLLALLVTVTVVLGSSAMAGRWGVAT